MNNSKLFENSYAEITLPLSEKAIGVLRRIKSLDSITSEYDRLLDNPAVTDTFMEMTICFDFGCMETMFDISVAACYDGFADKVSECNVHFDRKTADYFQNEALNYLARNFKKMKECRTAAHDFKVFLHGYDGVVELPKTIQIHKLLMYGGHFSHPTIKNLTRFRLKER